MGKFMYLIDRCVILAHFHDCILWVDSYRVNIGGPAGDLTRSREMSWLDGACAVSHLHMTVEIGIYKADRPNAAPIY